jgi:Predicted protein-tyrosine phosphatase
MSKILDNLYLSSVAEARNPKYIKNNKITHVLIAAKGLKQYFNSITYKQLNIADNPITMISHYFAEALKFIDEALAAGKTVLVHCLGGKSRSVSVVIAYLMFSQKKSFEDAYILVKTARRVANPNPGFISQLKAFEKVLDIYFTQRKDAMLKEHDYTLLDNLIKTYVTTDIKDRIENTQIIMKKAK